MNGNEAKLSAPFVFHRTVRNVFCGDKNAVFLVRGHGESWLVYVVVFPGLLLALKACVCTAPPVDRVTSSLVSWAT